MNSRNLRPLRRSAETAAGVIRRTAARDDAARRTTALRAYIDLVTIFADRNIKARYRGSFLGVFWSLSNPVFMTAIYTAIFGTAFARYYGGSLRNYVLACFVGLTVLSFFSQTSTQALGSIVNNGALVNKIRIPLSIFPVGLIAANAFQYAVSVLPVLVVVTLAVSGRPTHLVWLIFPLVSLLLVTAGFSLIAAALFVFFRDLPYLYELVVFVMWITSPIFYPAAVVPDAVRPYLTVNPLSSLITSVREVALSPTHPELRVMLGAVGAGAFWLAVGIAVFASLRPRFMDRL